MGFSNVGLGIVHSMAHSLGAVYDTPHGVANAILLPAVMEYNAEATGEKLALGYAYDGRINIIFGTHTHVQTADERILPNGTGYITDVGMCGESEGILGMDPDIVVLRMRSSLPHNFKSASGKVLADGVIFTLDTSSGRVTKVESVSF